MRKAQEQYYQDYQNNADQSNRNSYSDENQRNNNVNADVIDVEYTEKEDK
ncbi:MAG: hypothetical protein RSC59_08010 [Erysipelotrichaceae bacterium]